MCDKWNTKWFYHFQGSGCEDSHDCLIMMSLILFRGLKVGLIIIIIDDDDGQKERLIEFTGGIAREREKCFMMLPFLVLLLSLLECPTFPISSQKTDQVMEHQQ